MSDCCASSSPPDKPAASDFAALPSFIVRPGVTCPAWSVVTSRVVKAALLTMFESGHVLNRWLGYSYAEDQMRTGLLRLYADHGRAPSIDALAARTGLSATDVRSQLANLQQRDLVVLSRDGERIIGAYPFTERETGHRIKLDGRTINAMCAVDALGAGAMLGRDIQIDSRCFRSGTAIRITTRDRGRALAVVPPETTAVWLGLRYEGGSAAFSLCTVTAFFRTDADLDAWRKEQLGDEPGVRLSIGEALEAGRAIFEPSLADLETSRRPAGRMD